MDSNAFVFPKRGVLGTSLNYLVNHPYVARVRRAIMSRLPFMCLESDVADIVYLNWVIDSSSVTHLIPDGVVITQRGEKTILTLLTYQHHHFGPAFLRWIRCLFPSPLQSNWRLYVERLPASQDHQNAVLFIKNIFNNALYAVVTRIFSDALPSHLARSFEHVKCETTYTTKIRSGMGSAPELYSVVNECDEKRLPSAFCAFFSSWEDAVASLSWQDSAICAVETTGGVAQAGISLPIDVSSIKSAQVSECVPGEFLASIGVKGEPFCYVVPRVKFSVLWEKMI